MSLLDETFGSVLITIFIASILYGVTTLQTYIYSQKYQGDTRFLKLTVATVWVLETFHIAFCIMFIYVYLINHFGDLHYLSTNIHWSGGVSLAIVIRDAGAQAFRDLGYAGLRPDYYSYRAQVPRLSGIVIESDAVPPSFYVYRVWIVSNGSIPLTGIVAFFAVARFGGNLGTIALSYIFNEWEVYRSHVISLVLLCIGLGSGAVVDVLTAGIMIYQIRRGKTGIRQSDNMANLIILYTINTGALTSIASTLIPIMFAADANSLAYLGLVEIQSKLYSNTFLATLNARQHIRDKFSHDAIAYANSSLHFSSRVRTTTVASEPPLVSETAIGTYNALNAEPSSPWWIW
ncbi:hypothetical protein NM688_g225 [Phlebia brevispora]|uniref:Uncharacterized protein n=1 Tax=Phlebia brevispora TaxID=194682 RepID=A0ACC1TES7_9APHY|nr:hypothetical protein NM688_g225 [Phlebia brevispora]